MTPQEAADELIGTCRTFSEAMGADIEDMPRVWLTEIDTLVMQCDQCGWWVDAHEVNDDQICEECREP